MFVSLNKKILYSLLGFLVLLVGIFFVIFINLYSQKLQDSQNSVYMRNQYVLGLIYENVNLQKTLKEISEAYPEIQRRYNIEPFTKGLDEAQQEFTNEQKLNEELRKNYNKNREAIITGGKVVGISTLVVILMIFLLIFLLDYWVIRPIEKLIHISHNVSAGIFSSRIPVKTQNRMHDEFDILFTTFNQMLDNTEQNIEEMKSREKFLQQLIDAIPDGIRVIDKDYKVVMANSAFYKMLDLRESCVGKKCYECYGYKKESCPQSRYTCPLKYLSDEKNSFLHTIHEVGKSPLYVNAAQLKFGFKEDDFHIVEAFHDLRQDVNYSHQQKVTSLAFLSTSIAHEMKNNLGAIRLILEGLLENDYKDVSNEDDRKKYLLKVHEQLVETVKIPERLLKLAQYSATDTVEIDVSSAIKDMILMIDYDAKRRGIIINTNFEPNLSFFGNEADFKMIILNLTQNAIKAMPEGGELRLTTEKNNRQIILNISDTGVGIDAEKIKHIFEPFYSANSQSKSSGLGLAIVRSLVEKAHGSIHVKSRVGKGTRFTVKFPQKSTPEINTQA